MICIKDFQGNFIDIKEIFLDFQFGNICVSRCVDVIPWLGYTRFNNILTCPPPHVRLALWVNNPVRDC